MFYRHFAIFIIAFILGCLACQSRPVPGFLSRFRSGASIAPQFEHEESSAFKLPPRSKGQSKAEYRKEGKRLWQVHQKSLAEKSLPPPSKVHQNDVRLVSFNVHKFKDPVTHELSIHKVFETLQKTKADVVALQEFPQKMLYCKEFTDWREKHGYKFMGVAKNSNLPHDSRYQVLLSKHPMTTQEHRLDGGLRGAVEGVVQVSPDRQIHVSNVHLSWGPKKEALRVSQIRQLSELAELRSSQYGIKERVLLGDFNMDLNESHLSSSWKNAADSMKNKIGTHWKGKRLDHILTSNDVNTGLVHVIHTDASDHLPIMMDIGRPKAEAEPTLKEKVSLKEVQLDKAKRYFKKPIEERVETAAILTSLAATAALSAGAIAVSSDKKSI